MLVARKEKKRRIPLGTPTWYISLHGSSSYYKCSDINLSVRPNLSTATTTGRDPKKEHQTCHCSPPSPSSHITFCLSARQDGLDLVPKATLFPPKVVAQTTPPGQVVIFFDQPRTRICRYKKDEKKTPANRPGTASFQTLPTLRGPRSGPGTRDQG
jgi:hypothetical protein